LADWQENRQLWKRWNSVAILWPKVIIVNNFVLNTASGKRSQKMWLQIYFVGWHHAIDARIERQMCHTDSLKPESGCPMQQFFFKDCWYLQKNVTCLRINSQGMYGKQGPFD
jgi:hypothetical protein